MKRKRPGGNVGLEQRFHHSRRHDASATAATAVADADDAAGAAQSATPLCIPDPYYPIYLPIDQEFKAKYVFSQRKGKTFKERLYVFLEHPCGWLCFVYHFTV